MMAAVLEEETLGEEVPAVISKKVKRRKKTKAIRILDAVDALNKAMEMEEPHLRIYLPGGLDSRSQEAKEFVSAMGDFVRSYKKFYRLEKIEVDIVI